jgi:hypothetical protein
MEYALPVEFRQHGAQVDGFVTKVPCDARIGGVALYRPKAVAYGDGI